MPKQPEKPGNAIDELTGLNPLELIPGYKVYKGVIDTLSGASKRVSKVFEKVGGFFERVFDSEKYQNKSWLERAGLLVESLIDEAKRLFEDEKELSNSTGGKLTEAMVNDAQAKQFVNLMGSAADEIEDSEAKKALGVASASIVQAEKGVAGSKDAMSAFIAMLSGKSSEFSEALVRRVAGTGLLSLAALRGKFSDAHDFELFLEKLKGATAKSPTLAKFIDSVAKNIKSAFSDKMKLLQALEVPMTDLSLTDMSANAEVIAKKVFPESLKAHPDLLSVLQEIIEKGGNMNTGELAKLLYLINPHELRSFAMKLGNIDSIAQ